MSAKVLDASIYKSGLKISLNKKHEIDTIITDPYEDSSGLEFVETKEVIDAILVSDGTSLNLPLINNSKTATRLVRGFCDAHMPMWGADYECAKGVAGVYMATKTITFGVDEPIQNPEVVLEFEGQTISLHSGGKTFDEYPAKFADGTTISNWIDTHQTSGVSSWVGNSQNVNYQGDSIFVHPFINKAIAAASSNPDYANMTDPQYITTRWTGGYAGGVGNAWTSSTYNRFKVRYVKGDSSSEGSTPVNSAGISDSMWPDIFFEGGGGSTSKEQQRIRYAQYNASESIKAEIEKVSTYQYKVHLTFPVKYIYYAISRYAQANWLWNNIVDHDSKAFIDRVKKVKVHFYAIRPIGKAGKESYSLDQNGSLTTSIVNKNVYSVGDNTFIKNGTKFGSVAWTKGFSSAVLGLYKEGKYTAAVDVPGSVALDEGIKVNTEIKLKDIRGNLFEKLGTKTETATFLTGSVNKLNVGTEYAIAKSPTVAPYPGGIIEMGSGLNNIEIKIKAGSYSSTIQNTIYANRLEVNFPNTTNPMTFYRADGSVALYITSAYGSDSTYLTMKLLSKPAQNVYMSWFISAIPGVVNTQINYIGNGVVVFKVKGIQKEFSNRGLIYRLNMIESTTEAIAALSIYYISYVLSALSRGREYFFKQPLSTLADAITRMDFTSNSFIFRRRNNITLALIEEKDVGRIVFNKSANTLSVYVWVAGTSYETHRVTDVNDYSNGDEFWTITKKVAGNPNEYPSGKATDLYNNIGGYIE